MIGGGDSTFYMKVMNSKETNKWKIAIQEELKSLHMNETYLSWSYQRGKKLLVVSFWHKETLSKKDGQKFKI